MEKESSTKRYILYCMRRVNNLFADIFFKIYRQLGLVKDFRFSNGLFFLKGIAFLWILGMGFAFTFKSNRDIYLEPVVNRVGNYVSNNSLSNAIRKIVPEYTIISDKDKPNARTMAPAATFPLERGMALVSRLSNPNAVSPGNGSDRSGFVLGVFDIRNPGDPANTAPAVATDNWNSVTNSIYRHPEWTNANMGEVFGLEIDNSVPASPQVFVGSNGTFVGNINGASQYAGRTLAAVGSTGGDVYRLDGNTGDVSLLTGAVPSLSYALDGGRGADDVTIPLNTSNGRIKSVDIVSGGSGYVIFEPLVFTGGGGTGATGYVTVGAGGVVTGIVLTARGSGYGTDPVTVTVNSGAGTGFVGAVTIGYPLQTGVIPVANGGSGYTDASATPLVIDGDGSGSVVTRTITSGVLTQFNVTVAGVDYTVAPSVTINNRFTGVGNIGYNYAQKVVYTTSLDNGNIYAIDAETGAFVGAAYDHLPGVADNPGLAVTDIRRMAVGMAWNPRDNRLYFSRPDVTGYSVFLSVYYRFTHNEVVSIGLNADGSINAADVQRQEIRVPVTALGGVAGQYSLITDIEFTSDGLISLLGEMSTGAEAFRRIDTEYRVSKGSHNAIAREYRFTGDEPEWVLETDYRVGNTYSGYNNTGGADFGYGNSENPEEYYDSAVLTADYVNGTGFVYGIQISPLSQGNYPTTGGGEYRHYIVDDNVDFAILFAEKTGVGDVDVFSGVDYPAEDLELSLTVTYPTDCNTSDGVISLTGSGSGLFPNTPYPVSYVVDGGAPITASIVTDESGVIHIPNLPPGVYTEIKINDPPTYTSNELAADLSCIILSGTVFHDINGLNPTPANTVDGTPIQTPSGTALHANLFAEDGTFIATVPIDSEGNYEFDVVTRNTNYQVTISITPATAVSTPATSTDLPEGWVNTGENVGLEVGSDGTVDGMLAASVLETDRPEVNFGIQQVPETSVNLQVAQLNPGGTTCVTVPPSAFSVSNVIDPMTEELYPDTEDPSPGAVTGIVITGFPTNVISITIDGVSYTNLEDITATYPAGIPTDASGVPSVSVCVDPADGEVEVVIPIAAIDAAGFQDPTPGSITMPFNTPVILSGTVFHDINGLNPTPANTVDGTPIQTPSGTALHANLFAEDGTFIATVPIDSEGNYEFDVVTRNTNYQVTISITPATALSTPATSTDLPDGWVNTGENVGLEAGSDGTVDGMLAASVLETDRPEVNFGIQQVPDSEDVSEELSSQPFLNQQIPLDGVLAPLLGGSDTEDYPLGGSLTGRTVAITSLPDNGELWYGGTQITVGDDGENPVSIENPFTITDLVPEDLSLVLTAEGSESIAFNYAYVDEAGFIDPTPATYELTWSAPLPVNLIKFTGTLEGAQVQLRWETSSEVNSSHFVVEHSVGGKVWSQLTSVNAAGASLTPVTYSATHLSPRNGLNLYRLKMVDHDGSFELSPMISILISNGVTVRVFPNPVHEQLKIETDNWSDLRSIKVIDANGRILLTKSSGFRDPINVGRLPGGVYIITVESTGGVVSYRRIVISK